MSQLNLPLLGSLGGLTCAIAGVVVLFLAARQLQRGRKRQCTALGGGVLLAAGLAVILIPWMGDAGIQGMLLAAVDTAAPVGGWMLIAFCAAIVLWGLFADRAAGRRRCPKCWYSMEGVSALKCPECGHEAGVERRLFKTRRQWRMVAGGVLAGVVGCVGAMWTHIRVFGVGSLLPTPVLVLALEVEGWPRPASYRPPDLAATFVHRVPRASPWVQDLAQRRMARYWTIDYRRKWLAGVPISVRPAVNWGYSALGQAGAFEARLADGDGAWVRLDPQVVLNQDRMDDQVSIGSLPKGSREMVIELRFVPSVSNRPAAPPLWNARVSYPIEIVESMEEILTPVSDPEIDEDIAAGFQVQSPRATLGFVIGSYGRSFGFDLQGAAHNKGVTAAMRVEFVKGTEVVARGRAWNAANGKSRAFGGLECLVEMDPGTAHDVLDAFVPGTPWTVMAPWSVRITADPVLALRDFGSSRYWTGTVILPATK